MRMLRFKVFDRPHAADLLSSDSMHVLYNFERGYSAYQTNRFAGYLTFLVRGRLTPAHCLPGTYENVGHMHQSAAGLTAVGSSYIIEQFLVRLDAKQIIDWF
jgi:hypothetical protein